MHSHLPRCLSDCSCFDEFAALLQLQQTPGTKSRLTGLFLFHFHQKSKQTFSSLNHQLNRLVFYTYSLCCSMLQLNCVSWKVTVSESVTTLIQKPQRFFFYRSKSLAKKTEQCILGDVSVMTPGSLTPEEQTGLISSCLKSSISIDCRTSPEPFALLSS